MVVKTLDIIALSHAGEGLTKPETGALHVPFTLPGERIHAEIQGTRARLISLVQTSPDRTAAPCEYFGRCGGCAVQHLKEDAYRKWKRSLLVDALQRRSIETCVNELVDGHGRGRRRVVLHVRQSNDAVRVGFMEGRTHDLVDLDRCPLLEQGLAGIFLASRAMAGALNCGNSGFDLQFTFAANGIDCSIIGLPRDFKVPIAAVAGVAATHRLLRVSRHDEVLLETGRPEVRCASAMVSIPPSAFLQATEEAQSCLAALVSRYVGKAKNAADFFCGIGPFTLGLAEHRPVTAMDVNGPAVAALRSAASRARGLRPIVGHVRDLFREPPSTTELKSFDAIVFNPPRKGAEALCRNLVGSGVKTIVAVSCNPDTFARDAAILTKAGYDLSEVTPVDQFRWSPHLEMVGLFSRAVKKS